MPVPPRPLIGRAAAVGGPFVVTIGASLWAAAAGRGWLLVVAASATVVVELAMRLRAIDIAQLLAQAGLGLPARAALGVIALVLLAGRELRHSIAVGTAVVGVLIVVGTAGFVGLRQVAQRVAQPPLVTRNLALGVPPLPTPPRLISEPPSPGVLAIVVAAIGLAIDCGTTATTAAAVALAIATALAVLPAAVLAGHVVRVLGSGARNAASDAGARAVERLAPQVVLYFASTPQEVYQVNQWLDVVARLGRPAMVLVRSYEVMNALAPTDLPIVCSPYNGTIASLFLPERVVTLFPTHSGNNLSMIRRSETRTVFVSHGDSDKPDSINPFAKVYDEVWVAGPLGRRRYAEAAVGVADASIVEIGRPQIVLPSAPPPQPPVVVYAPTWEGWGDDPHHSSLAQIGPALIRALTARPGIEVRYRPHPLTGVRSPQLRVADREIASLVGRVSTDESLNATFATAAAVIADVSSVVPEFLPYDRPYAVPDTRGLGSAEFIARFPSAAAGFVIDPELGGLDAFLTAATGGPDPTAADRRALMHDALGDPATSQQRFAAAVDRLLSQ